MKCEIIFKKTPKENKKSKDFMQWKDNYNTYQGEEERKPVSPVSIYCTLSVLIKIVTSKHAKIVIIIIFLNPFFFLFFFFVPATIGYIKKFIYNSQSCIIVLN